MPGAATLIPSLRERWTTLAVTMLPAPPVTPIPQPEQPSQPPTERSTRLPATLLRSPAISTPSPAPVTWLSESRLSWAASTISPVCEPSTALATIVLPSAPSTAATPLPTLPAKRLSSTRLRVAPNSSTPVIALSVKDEPRTVLRVVSVSASPVRLPVEVTSSNAFELPPVTSIARPATARTVRSLTRAPLAFSTTTPVANSRTVPPLIVTLRCPASRIPAPVPAPSIVRRPRSSVIPSAPITSPSAGQLVRSARSLVCEVIVEPQATPLACDVAGTANSIPIAGAMTYLKAVICGTVPIQRGHTTSPSRTSTMRS